VIIIKLKVCLYYALIKNSINKQGIWNNITRSVGHAKFYLNKLFNWPIIWFVLQVAWLRVDTQTILTIATHVITKNHRIAVTHSGHRAWSLHIRETRKTDSGWYMCQVNTDPMSSITGFLEVVGKDQDLLIFS